MAHYPLADVLWGTDHSYVVDNRETEKDAHNADEEGGTAI